MNCLWQVRRQWYIHLKKSHIWKQNLLHHCPKTHSCSRCRRCYCQHCVFQILKLPVTEFTSVPTLLSTATTVNIRRATQKKNNQGQFNKKKNLNAKTCKKQQKPRKSWARRALNCGNSSADRPGRLPLSAVQQKPVVADAPQAAHSERAHAPL